MPSASWMRARQLSVASACDAAITGSGYLRSWGGDGSDGTLAGGQLSAGLNSNLHGRQGGDGFVATRERTADNGGTAQDPADDFLTLLTTITSGKDHGSLVTTGDGTTTAGLRPSAGGLLASGLDLTGHTKTDGGQSQRTTRTASIVTPVSHSEDSITRTDTASGDAHTDGTQKRDAGDAAIEQNGTGGGGNAAAVDVVYSHMANLPAAGPEPRQRFESASGQLTARDVTAYDSVFQNYGGDNYGQTHANLVKIATENGTDTSGWTSGGLDEGGVGQYAGQTITHTVDSKTTTKGDGTVTQNGAASGASRTTVAAGPGSAEGGGEDVVEVKSWDYDVTDPAADFTKSDGLWTSRITTTIKTPKPDAEPEEGAPPPAATVSNVQTVDWEDTWIDYERTIYDTDIIHTTGSQGNVVQTVEVSGPSDWRHESVRIESNASEYDDQRTVDENQIDDYQVIITTTGSRFERVSTSSYDSSHDVDADGLATGGTFQSHDFDRSSRETFYESDDRTEYADSSPHVHYKYVHHVGDGTAQTRTAEETGTYFDDPLGQRVQRADYKIIDTSATFQHTWDDTTSLENYVDGSPAYDLYFHHFIDIWNTDTHGTTTTGSYDEWSDLRTTLNWTRQDDLLNDLYYETEKYADGRDGWRNTIHHLETHRPDTGSASGLEYSFVTGWHTNVVTPNDNLGDIWRYVTDPTVNNPPTAPEPAGHFEHWAIVNGAPHDPLTNHDPLPAVGPVTTVTAKAPAKVFEVSAAAPSEPEIQPQRKSHLLLGVLGLLFAQTGGSNYRREFIDQTPDMPNDWRVHHPYQQALRERYLLERNINVDATQHLRGVDPKIHGEITAIQNSWWAERARELEITETDAYKVVPLSKVDELMKIIDKKYNKLWIKVGAAAPEIAKVSKEVKLALKSPLNRAARIADVLRKTKTALGIFAIATLVLENAALAKNIAHPDAVTQHAFDEFLTQYGYTIDEVLTRGRFSQNRFGLLHDALSKWMSAVGVPNNIRAVIEEEMTAVWVKTPK